MSKIYRGTGEPINTFRFPYGIEFHHHPYNVAIVAVRMMGSSNHMRVGLGLDS